MSLWLTECFYPKPKISSGCVVVLCNKSTLHNTRMVWWSYLIRYSNFMAQCTQIRVITWHTKCTHVSAKVIYVYISFKILSSMNMQYFSLFVQPHCEHSSITTKPLMLLENTNMTILCYTVLLINPLWQVNAPLGWIDNITILFSWIHTYVMVFEAGITYGRCRVVQHRVNYIRDSIMLCYAHYRNKLLLSLRHTELRMSEKSQ